MIYYNIYILKGIWVAGTFLLAQAVAPVGSLSGHWDLQALGFSVGFFMGWFLSPASTEAFSRPVPENRRRTTSALYFRCLGFLRGIVTSIEVDHVVGGGQVQADASTPELQGFRR